MGDQIYHFLKILKNWADFSENLNDNLLEFLYQKIMLLYKLTNFLLVGYSLINKTSTWLQLVNYKFFVNFAIFIKLNKKLRFQIFELILAIAEIVNFVHDFLHFGMVNRLALAQFLEKRVDSKPEPRFG